MSPVAPVIVPGLAWGGIALAAGVGAYCWGWRGMRRRWMISNIPTSRVRSVAMGMAELIGKTRVVGTPLKSPVRRLDCVWFRVRVTRTSGSGKNRRTRTVFRQEAGAPFELEDVTGRILVYPDGAEVTGIETCHLDVVNWDAITGDALTFCDRIGVTGRSGIDIREWVVMADAEAYVLGDVGKTRDAAAERMKRVGALLRDWLKSPERKAAIDTDRDGRIDQKEWDAARGEAQTEALKEEAVAPPAPAVAVRKPRSGYFIIAAGGEKAALAAQGYPVALVVLGILLVGAGTWILQAAGSVPAVAWGAVGAGAASGGWAVFRHLRS